MSWNPWADNRALRTIIADLDVSRRRLTDRIEALERTNDILRTQTHRRDPVTGRILPKGK
jgi:hypothetical protein